MALDNVLGEKSSTDSLVTVMLKMAFFWWFELTLTVMQRVMDPPCCFFAEELSKAYP